MRHTAMSFAFLDVHIFQTTRQLDGQINTEIDKQIHKVMDTWMHQINEPTDTCVDK